MADQTSTNNQEDESKGKVYWFFYNLKKKVFGGLWQWSKKHWILAPLLLLLVLYILFTGRSAIQPFFIFVRKYLFLILIFLLSCLLLYLILKKGNIVFKVLASILFAAILGVTIFFGKSIHEYVSLYIHYKSIDKVELAQLPTTENERIQPLNSIRTLIRQEAISETEEATSPHFLRRPDGRYDWTVCVGPSPEYTIQRLSKNMSEVISVSATSPAPDFSGGNRHQVKFDIGEFLMFSKKTKNAIIKSFNAWQYITYQPSDVRFLQKENGDWIQVVSLIRWKGFFFPRPIFGGTMIIEQNSPSFKRTLSRMFIGDGHCVKPSQISKYAFLEGQNLVPESVSQFTAESFRFQEGFLAPMPGYHEGDIRIPIHAEDHNEMPYVTYFKMKSVDKSYRNTLFHYFGLEPYQENKRGLNTSVFVPADGENVVYYIAHASKKDGFIGSSAIGSKIIESRKNYDWTKNHPAESRPYIKDINGKRHFFWLNSVVTKTNKEGDEFIGGTIPDITLTDAKFGKVLWVEPNDLGSPAKWKTQIKKEFGDIWGEDQFIIEEDQNLDSTVIIDTVIIFDEVISDSLKLDNSEVLDSLN